ncbi:phosphoglucosamine mutase [Thermodesulfobacteriota bacterium]
MGTLFGTDGIRGRVNQSPMTPEMALRVGKTAAVFFRSNTSHKRPKIVIGRDTRLSGSMIESALVSGLCSLGADTYLTGVLPTPGVAYLTTHLAADAGIVVSASHNPFYDNGIKFFNDRGFKLNDAMENDLEQWILDDHKKQPVIADNAIGKVFPVPDAGMIYSNFLLNALPPDIKTRIGGLKVVLDCSNGATSTIAPDLFSCLGVGVIPLSTSPDGININDACGSQHPETLAKKVLESGSDVGFAFDGDGDRLIAVDETGNILTGDQLIAIFAGFYRQHHLLTNQTVVTTVMSNMGLGKALSDMRVTHLKSTVGDRYVMEQMIVSGAVIGGEDSGHIIFLDAHTTGDGILAALQFLRVLVSEKATASQLAEVMMVFPQELMNVTVDAKPAITDIDGLSEAVTKIEKQLGDTGRVLIRYSGTQPMCRVMVEASTKSEAIRFCKQLTEIIKTQIGK